MKKYRVLHISPTPLVDSPRKISDCLNSFTNYQSDVIVFNDYPGALKGMFTVNALVFSEMKELCLSIIADADIIHIHNFLNSDQENIIFDHFRSDVKFIYQAHSPLREGPVFTEYATDDGLIQFDEKCVVAQYQPRLYPDYTIVPNLVTEHPCLNLLQDDELPVLLFSPAHTRTGGRWNDKTTSNLDRTLNSLEQLGLIKLIIASGYSPQDLFKVRARSHITIDEIITGAFHQISLEGLCAGNVVINNSDFFSNLMMKSIIQKDIDLPFYPVSSDNLERQVMKLVTDKELIRKYQNDSYTFYIDNLLPENLIKHYVDMYDRVIIND